MFTSRAEFRLHLREDNADARLMPAARRLGLLDDVAWSAFNDRQLAIETAVEALGELRFVPNEATRARLADHGLAPVNQPTTALELIRRPEVELARHGAVFDAILEGLAPEVCEAVEIRIKYEGYITRQDRQVAQFERHERVRLPDDLDYAEVHGLTTEARERLSRARPASLGAAGRLSGVTPAAVTAIRFHLRKRSEAPSP